MSLEIKLEAQKPIQLHLAPMEGVMDWVMRDTLTRIGGIDHCVTEFLRITDQLYPDYIFYKNCPELKTQSQTRAGTPVYLQLLGGQAVPMAENAARAVELGAKGIDLNFGCPAKTVNRHDGGAALLKSCSRLFEITSQVRKTVPPHIPVTVKIRLGYDSPEACVENALAIQEAGAHRLTVHCRTKTDGYKPPAYWDWIPKIKEKVKIPVVANGEIWTLNDFKNCKEQTQCTEFMIGRGALSNPYLFLEIKNLFQTDVCKNSDPKPWKKLLFDFYEASENFKSSDFAVRRTKQWLRGLALQDAEAHSAFQDLKIIIKPLEFKERLKSYKETNASV